MIFKGSIILPMQGENNGYEIQSVVITIKPALQDKTLRFLFKYKFFCTFGSL